MRTKMQPTKKPTTKSTAKSTTAKRTTAGKAAPKKAPPKAEQPDQGAKPTEKPTAKATAKKPVKKTSALDAAATVLADAKTPMSTKELIDAMAQKKLWSSPGGKTPDRTLYSAILREVATKGTDARFKKAERGKFALAAK